CAVVPRASAPVADVARPPSPTRRCPVLCCLPTLRFPSSALTCLWPNHTRTHSRAALTLTHSSPRSASS
ncbi:histone H3, putative, partial [Leishmania donovani]